MKSSKKISIVTATYNCEQTIRPLAESLRDQSFDDFEWVIQDGKSTDDTVEKILNIFPDALVDVRADKSVYDAWNMALARCSGEFVLFLGGDDFLLDNSVLLDTARMLCDYKKIYYGGMFLFSDKRKQLYSHRLFSAESYGRLLDLPIHAFPPAPATFLPRETVSQIKFDTQFHYHADAVMFYELLKRGCTYSNLSIDISGMGDQGLTSNSQTKFLRQREKLIIYRKYRKYFKNLKLLKISKTKIMIEIFKNYVRSWRDKK